MRTSAFLSAMLRVPRHAFVPPEAVAAAYNDQPLSIGEGQTISQPYMVAAMTQALQLAGHERVLEVGTGSGYQTAVLSLLAGVVHTIETIAALAEQARERLGRLGYANVQVHVGDGTRGWAAAAPYDAIVVTAAAPSIPSPLIAQLADGGRVVLPVGGSDTQELVRVTRKGYETIREFFFHCRFVPLIGEYGWSGDTPKDPAE